MKYIRKARFRPRYRRPGKIHPLRRLLVLALCLMVLWAAACEAGLRFITPQLTQAVVEDYLRAVVNRAVSEELEENGAVFANVESNGSGQVTSITADGETLNRLKTGLLERLEKSFKGKAKAYVPIGSLTGLGIFNGRGPKAPLKLNLQGSADVLFETEFVSAGVNQSCHRITMKVHVHAYSQSRRFETAAEIETATVLAETVVVGAVPNMALLQN